MILCDSNILIYAYNSSSPYHKSSVGFLEKYTKIQNKLCICPQVLLEFFGIITQKVDYPITSSEAEKVCRTLQQNNNIATIYPKENTHMHAVSLAKQYDKKGRRIFDMVLTATMLDNNVRTIATRNVKHFEVISELSVIDPTK